jgi:NAD+ kinase
MGVERKRVLILANADKDAAVDTAALLAARLPGLGAEGATFVLSGGGPVESPRAEGFDLIVSLGGDGTVLFASRLAAPLGIPVLPINLGRLGFIAEIGKSDWEGALEAWAAGRLPVSERLMLAIEALRGGRRVAGFWALNDATISAQGIAKLIGLGVRVGKSSVVGYRADGVIVATPTGSTAYNLAAGGPVLNPEMDAMIFNPVNPFTLSNRPLVLGASETVEILVEEERRASVMLTVDGQETFGLLAGDRVVISGAPRKALIHVSERFAFFELLRSKLAWSGGAGA